MGIIPPFARPLTGSIRFHSTTSLKSDLVWFIRFMDILRRQSVIDQAAEHLRQGLRGKHWEERMPGEAALAKALGVSKATARSAVLLLEKEGLLENTGSGRRRVIVSPGQEQAPPRSLRVAFLLSEPIETENAEMQAILLNIKHAIAAAGHDCFFTTSNLTGMKGDVRRIARHVGKTPADAWIVGSAARHVLEWFSRQPVPALAFAGRSVGVPIAAVGNDLTPALIQSVRMLTAYGHRRIVMICPEIWRTPTPARYVTTFLDELSSCGIRTGPYNVPDWHDSPRGFHELLENLFRSTPPTALLTSEPKQTVAAISFFAQHRLKLGIDVSLIAMLSDPSHSWIRPPLAQFGVDRGPLIRDIVRWVASVHKGKPHRKACITPSWFDPGGSIGPAPK